MNAHAMPARSGARPYMVKALLLCGILAPIVYVAADIVGALNWQEYSYTGQSVSELSAIDAPSRPFVLPLFLAYDLLVAAFGLGIWAADRRPALRVTALMQMGIGALGLPATLFGAMHLRGVAPTLSDTLHIGLTAVTVLFIFVGVGFAINAFGRRFRLYSFVTLAALLVFGLLGALDGPRVAANLPTPWLGVTERLCIGAYLLWTAVLAVMLLRRRRRGTSG